MNKRIVILGANGQVASEIILEIKKQDPTAEIIGVCRNKLGSLFLRYNKIPVVHASIESDGFPIDLLKDANVIVNTVYVRGKPAEVKKRHENILRKIFMYAGEKTKIVHFSTVSVFYGGIYAEEKLHQERTIKMLAHKYKKKAIILRVGQVLGPNQGLSSVCLKLAKRIKRLNCENDANCVSIKYLGEIVLDIYIKNFDNFDTDTYSAVFNPIVTWFDIFNLFGVIDIECSSPRPENMLNSLFSGIRGSSILRNLFMSIERRLPSSIEKKIYARHLLSRVQEDIRAISQDVVHPELTREFFWKSAPGERYHIARNITKEEILPFFKD